MQLEVALSEVRQEPEAAGPGAMGDQTIGMPEDIAEPNKPVEEFNQAELQAGPPRPIPVNLAREFARFVTVPNMQDPEQPILNAAVGISSVLDLVQESIGHRPPTGLIHGSLEGDAGSVPHFVAGIAHCVV